MKRLYYFLFTFFLHISYLFARAGGGGGFSSGGGGGGFSGGGGSSGSGDGLGYLVYLLIKLTFKHPLIGIPVDIVVGVLIYYSYKTSYSANQGRVIRKAVRISRQSNLKQKIDEFCAKDSSFSAADFLNRTEKTFLEIQKAWSDNDLKDIRVLMSDGVYERFNTYLAIQKESKLVNVMDSVKVLNREIIAVESTEFFDTLHVRINASAIDYFINSENGKMVFGGKTPSPFTEIWSFIRKPGVNSANKSGLIEGNCPNCGSPLSMADTTECASCKAVVNSGEYDWVLSEITQDSEWSVPQKKAVPGLIEMSRKDPGFCLQFAEDKASVVFWRLRQAEFFADDRYIAKHFLKSLKDKRSEDFYSTSDGKHRFYQDAAVGSVEVVGIEPAGENEEMDKISVLIKWSGHREEKEVPSLIVPEWHKSTLHREVFTFVRNKNVLTETKRGMLSSHCVSCGAPESLGLLGECHYCGAAQNDGSKGWVLESIISAGAYNFKHSPAGVAAATASEPQEVNFEESLMTNSTLSAEQNKDLIICLAAMMLADDVIDQKERGWLEKMALARGISNHDLDIIIQSVQSGSIKPAVPEDIKQGKDFFRLMVRMCLLDGKVTSDEKSLLMNLTGKLGYSELDLGYMIKHEKAVLYREAKQYLKKK